MKCPICKGSGVIPFHKSISKEAKIVLAKQLKNDGNSIREIMQILGYKSPKSVQDLLTTKPVK